MFLRAVSVTGGRGRLVVEWAWYLPVPEPLPENVNNPTDKPHRTLPPDRGQGMHLARCTRLVFKTSTNAIRWPCGVGETRNLC